MFAIFNTAILIIINHDEGIMMCILCESVKISIHNANKCEYLVDDDDINLSESGVLYDDEIKNLCYFPTLPLICRRRNYEADSSKRAIVCTKQETGHPSLLPAVFTLFCHHGKLLALVIKNLTFVCTIL